MQHFGNMLNLSSSLPHQHILQRVTQNKQSTVSGLIFISEGRIFFLYLVCVRQFCRVCHSFQYVSCFSMLRVSYLFQFLAEDATGGQRINGLLFPDLKSLPKTTLRVASKLALFPKPGSNCGLRKPLQDFEAIKMTATLADYQNNQINLLRW